MAKRWALLAVGLCVFITAGCSSTTGNRSTSTAAAKRGSMFVAVPPPSFSGPNLIAAKPAPVAAPAIPAPQPPSGPSAWVPRVPPRDWTWIVIHHSASPSGNMAMFDREHKAKGWDGVGYHFVIGNGTNSGDGQIEVTPRWPIQKWGAHAKTLDNRYNEHGIGICLVGNFDSDRPTAKQMESLTRLVSYLMRTYRISSDYIVGHRDTKPTECPGRYVSVAAIRRMATQAMADAGGSTAVEHANARSATGELLGDVTP
jgi:hypothetical protein